VAAPPQVEEDDSEPEDDGDITTPGMAVLHNMEAPRSRKLLAIIERTASFVAGQGGQMEILIKAKQASNPRFRFMTLDHRLNKFYRHILKRIQCSLYRPKIVPEDPEPAGGAEDAGDAGDAGSGTPADKAADADADPDPDPDADADADVTDSLFALPQVESAPSIGGAPGSTDGASGTPAADADPEPPAPTTAPPPATLVIPPPDIKRIVDKLAEYVARNGDDFEKGVRANKQGDPDYGFLLPWHEYNSYYKDTAAFYKSKLEPTTAPANGPDATVLTPAASTTATAEDTGLAPGSAVGGKKKKKSGVEVKIVRVSKKRKVEGGKAAGAAPENPTAAAVSEDDIKAERKRRLKAFLNKKGLKKSS